MADGARHEPLLWAAGVLGAAALVVVIGLLTPPRARVGASPAMADADARRSDGPAMDAAPGPLPPPLDPQPEITVSHIAFSVPPPFDAPEAAALLERLGGSDPALSGLTRVDPRLDDMSMQRAIREVPGASVHAVMGVIVQGGQSAGIGVEQSATDPVTGITTGRHDVMVVCTATVLQDGRVTVTAALRDERDTSALAVISRQAGLDLGRTGEAEGTLVLNPGERAAIRLPGRELQVVFLTIRAPQPPNGVEPPPGPGSEGPG
jgi:hypothetical protein